MASAREDLEYRLAAAAGVTDPKPMLEWQLAHRPTGVPPALSDLVEMSGRGRQRERSARLAGLGLNADSGLERRLGRRVLESTADAYQREG